VKNTYFKPTREEKEMVNGVLDTEKIIYYKKTVPYVLGGRRFTGDNIGFVLTTEQPWVAVKESALRDFKIANKRAIVEGLLIETDEPSVDWETSNVYTDEQIDDLFKSGIAKVRKALLEITSVSTVARMLERAKQQKRSDAMVEALEEKLEEIDHERVEIEDIERILDA
jgi:hypothetical protein